jgi:uncharacterized protein YndB with AHSA1/START domain
MGYEFSQEDRADVNATIDEVWTAIATGPGIDSWFMGKTEVADGVVRLIFGDQPVTASEPGRRFAYGGDRDPDGRFVAFDFMIEGRAGGGTSLRMVTSGFLPGDDWADEFDAMTKGGALYFHTLVEYLNRFAGRTAMPVTASSAPVTDWPAAWAAIGRALGLARRLQTGDSVAFSIDGRTIEGTVFFANEHTAGIRSDDAIYRFVMGFRPGGGGPMFAMHNLFAPGVDAGTAEKQWSDWLTRVIT